MADLEELSIPAAVANAEKKLEMARIWLADGNAFVALSAPPWEDPGTWGLLLVDLAKHAAGAYALEGFDYDEALARIRQTMEAEWSTPTAVPSRITDD